VRKFTVDATNPYPDTDAADCLISGTCLEAAIEDINPIFEAGELLAARDADERRIFTYIDKNNDKVLDEATYNSFDANGEVVTFDTSLAMQIKPYLGVADNTAWSYLGSDHDVRAANLIDYIRGKDAADLTGTVDTRNRTLNGNTWKLGDIVHSAPVSVAKPAEYFNIIYRDESYQHFFNAVKNRETMIYVGGNDGMLHAFTSWKFDQLSGVYTDPFPSDNPSDSTYINGEQIGDEVWAFIPQSLLPHLKWLADPAYIHSYYVDLMPKVFDAKILPDDTHYTDADSDDNWGTILIGGLNMGGKYIWSEGDYGSGTETRDFYPSYFCMDITDPRNPKLLWERTYANLAMSRSVPAVVKVGDKWFAVFGSGPTDYDGSSTQNGYIFVVDLKTGTPYGSGSDDWLFGPLEANAFMNSPVTLDQSLNYNVDGIYFGEAYLDGDWKGKVYKVTIPCTACEWDDPYPATIVYDRNPSNWTASTLFECDQPITAPMALSMDRLNNAWVYFGTGRYIGYNDRIDVTQQYLYGIKDPFFNADQANYYRQYSETLTLSSIDLFETDDIVVTTAGTVLEGNNLHDGVGTWRHLLNAVRSEDGWYRSLDTSAGPSERAVSKVAVLGGVIFSPTFTPNPDVCGYGGDSNFYALYFETGTAYINQIFNITNRSFVMVDGRLEQIVELRLPDPISGAPPPRVGIHSGREQGARAYLQQSTGQVVDLRIKPVLILKSGLTNWQEQ
jgi:type IV pilus assembly protein PilY1